MSLKATQPRHIPEEFIEKVNSVVGKFGSLGSGKRDISGIEFNWLTPVRLKSEKLKNYGDVWVCICRCGRVVEVPRQTLLSRKKPRMSCVCKPKNQNILPAGERLWRSKREIQITF